MIACLLLLKRQTQMFILTWKNNSKKIVVAHLNINSIRNKFDFLADIGKDNVDILMISESKLDDSFPDSQFLIE